MKPSVLELQQAGIELLGTGWGLGSSRRCRAPAAALGEGRQRRAPTAGRYVGDRVGLQPASSGSSRSNGKGRRRWVHLARWGKGGGGGIGSSSRDGERAAASVLARCALGFLSPSNSVQDEKNQRLHSIGRVAQWFVSLFVLGKPEDVGSIPPHCK
ncbi:hypothetical protein OsI_32718 [Oryza sativa Indica Group]|uniref:Uncharacterized protein n=1 Tax=Oryza sativa subsp. indica TaxID=39946 RepID=B8BFP9_ORYSI|nr:hypothetical protein OsI_32718 [Oryza sativa Indica Group]